MRAIIQKAIEDHTLQLGELWDKCLVPQYERDEFFSSLHARKLKKKKLDKPIIIRI
jgi:hypothetical protein